MTFQPEPVYWLTKAEWHAHLDPDGRWDPQCSKTTKRGTRCHFRIFGGQVYTIVNSGVYISGQDGERLHSGICPFHRKLEEAVNG